MKDIYIGLGANLGNRAANLRMALRYLSPLAMVEEVSSLYETTPVGPPSASSWERQPNFYNAVCRISSGLAPLALLRYLKSIEFEIGRRPDGSWAPRPIDLDFLLYGEDVVAVDGLALPHPRLAERAFVLAPLAEIAPELRHPVSGQSMAELLAALDEDDRAGVWQVESPGWEKGVSETR
jgi:2-amino-4-hydroxy-6-hydroxymethyldihydropteridine diphosphokinase